MANHVRRSEIVHQELEFLIGNALAQGVRDGRGGHFRIEIVGRYFGAGDQFAVFAPELFLDAAVEEEGDVGVLFGLGDVALFEVVGGEVFGQDVAHVLGPEGDGERVVGLVLGHGGDGDVFRVGEGGFGTAVDVAEELGDFSDAVGAVVEEEEGVVVVDAGGGAVDDDGFEELVVFALGVFLFDGGDGVGGGGDVGARAGDEPFHADFDAVPSLVAVHYVVAADDGG